MLRVSSLQLFWEVVGLFGRLAEKRNGGLVGPQRRQLRGTEEEWEGNGEKTRHSLEEMVYCGRQNNKGRREKFCIF